MKKILARVLFISLFLLSASVSHADLTTQYGINISDKGYDGNRALFQLFNDYFADQLGASELYTSGNQLYNDRGVDPNTDWTTNGSQLVGAFKVAAFGHKLSMIDSQTGATAGSIIDVAGTQNIRNGSSISDLSGTSVIDIADGLHVDFRLDASYYGNTMYSWSSDPEGNGNHDGFKGDDMVHMLALDITDLYNLKYDTMFDSVYMFGWEDLHKTAANGGQPADWDYQDFVAIVTNVTPNAATPEPSTMLIFLAGGGVASVVAWRKRRRNA